MIKNHKGMTGKHHSDEAKRKISEANRNPSEETRRKMSEHNVGMKGQHHTEEAKRKMSETWVGKVFWNNGVKNIRARECPGEGFVRGRGSF